MNRTIKEAGAVVLTDVLEFDTPAGGHLMIGRCIEDAQHMVIIAHCPLGDIFELADALRNAALGLTKEEGSA